jgi:hypothetical protein
MCKTLVVETAYRGSGVTLTYQDGNPEPQAVRRGPCAPDTRVTVTGPFSADQLRDDHLAEETIEMPLLALERRSL